MNRPLVSTYFIGSSFMDSLLNDYFDGDRTIVITTHQVEEIQHVLTDVMFINRGQIVLDASMERLESRFLEVLVSPECIDEARAIRPIHERQLFGRTIMLFDYADKARLGPLGEVRTPSIVDLFVAIIGGPDGRPNRSTCMSIDSEALPVVEPSAPRRAARSISTWNTLAWSVRREIWENKSVYIAPGVVALLTLLAVSIAVFPRADSNRLRCKR